MRAIARVNRVAANKKNGLIIDYNGMLKKLRKALATTRKATKARQLIRYSTGSGPC